MPWQSVSEFQTSKTYLDNPTFHGWLPDRLAKFVAAFKDVWDRMKRNGATDALADSSAYNIAYSVAQRAASAETMSRAEKSVSYFAAMVPTMAERNMNGSTIGGGEYKFNLITKSLPLLKTLVAGTSFNWDHEHGSQIGVIRDIILPSEAPPEVQAKVDPSVPFLFVASYRNDISQAARDEVQISPEWLVLDGNEAFPLTFAASHSPLNPKESGIHRVASEGVRLLFGEEKPVVAATTQTSTANPDGVTVTVNAETPVTVTTNATIDTATTVTIPAVVAVPDSAAKAYQSNAEYGDSGNPNMPDQPAATADLEARVASLSSTLTSETKMRQEAELKFAALKEQADRDHAQVEAMKVAALERDASEAAISLVKAGKAAADKAPYFAGLYKKLGKADFEEMAAALPANHVGETEAKAKAASEPVTISNELRESLRSGAIALMKAGA